MDSISLYELSEQLKYTIKNAFMFPVWIHAEISEVREAMNGHCYLELIEKEKNNNLIRAKIKANIWASAYRVIKPYFEQVTGQPLRQGLMIMVQVTIDYHEAYGISLSIRDIEPSYSLGDIARRRQEIISKLQKEGVFDMNKELPIPVTAQRIAIISSPSAAGYGDFMDQLMNNKNGYRFYCKLFPATMQGQQTEESIIEALDNIYQHIDFFDIVVIIRGGGASADLSAFDSYQLAYYCTQFPLPIVTGIGHLRDESILDMVAHTSVKTPTAVAEMLIGKAMETEQFINEASTRIFQHTGGRLKFEHNSLQNISKEISRLTQRKIIQCENDINVVSIHICNSSANIVRKQQHGVNNITGQLKMATNAFLKNKKQELTLLQKNISLLSPDYILSKGYSITTKNGNVIQHIDEINVGDEILTRFSSGTIHSKVTSK